MNLISTCLSNFFILYKQNLIQEINQNKELKHDLQKLSSTIIDLYNRNHNLITAIESPLKISDILIKKIYNNALDTVYKRLSSCNLDRVYDMKEKLLCGDRFRINVPQYYGGEPRVRKYKNFHGEVKPLSCVKNFFSKINKDECTIKKYENEIINSYFVRNSKKDMSHVKQLFSYIQNLNGIEKYEFNSIYCKDLRGIETDGFDLNEEIEFRFRVQMGCRFIRGYLRESISNFDCTMRFDEDEKLISFTFNEA